MGEFRKSQIDGENRTMNIIHRISRGH